jgi:hypothetical protein
MTLILIVWVSIGLVPCFWTLKSGVESLTHLLYALALCALGPIGFVWMVILNSAF